MGLGGGCAASVGPKSIAGERLDVRLHGGLFSRAGVGGSPPVMVHPWPCRLVGRAVVDHNTGWLRLVADRACFCSEGEHGRVSRWCLRL